MKLRIKYSNTQKFSIVVEELTFKALKENISSYVFSTYGESRPIESLQLSFNGKDPVIGNDNDSLASLGIVNGDLLTIIQSPVASGNQDCNKASLASSSTSSANIQLHKMNVERDSGNVCSTLNKVNNLLESRDGTPPPSVVHYFERYSPASANEAVNLLVHITMVEAGFVLGENPASTTTSLPLCWKDMAATFKYYHPGFQNFNCSVVLVAMGDVKQILVSFTGQENEISVKIKPKEYAQSSQILPHRLTKLSKFARTFRNDLLVPLQVAMHHTLGLPAPWHLAGLPQEILIKISSMLKVHSVLNLSSSCKRLNISLTDNKLWYNLFKRDFADQFHSSETISGADWRAKYKAVYERKREKERQNKQVPNQEQPWPFPNPGNPQNPYLPNPVNPFNPNPPNPYMPEPRGPDPIYPHPDPIPQPNPYWDPDSPYFGGEILPPRGPFVPRQPNPFDPFGNGRRPNNPLHPPFMPPTNPRGGPRFDFI